jgi:NADPH-dependent 2,4-dienoyl-CoA reductase/sulfur reductase-like enzyme
VFGSVENTDNDILPSDKMFESGGVNLKIGEVVSIDRENKVCKLKDGEKIGYDKLVLATGSTPTAPTWLKGADLDNVFTVPKDKVYLDEMQQKIKNHKKVIVIGGGFIGVELSDELTKAGKDVTLVEILPHVLELAFDEDFAIMAEDILKARGVNIKSGVGVKEILGNGKVSGVLLNDGEKLEADAVVLAMGYHPNTQLAQDAGIAINRHGFIQVDEYMRTEDPDIFAIGDCAEKRDFVTRKPNMAMLASTACAEARIAGMNLFQLSAVKTFSGTISIFSTALGDTGFGVAGLTETKAREEGFDIATGIFEGMDKHPGSLPGTKKQKVKLIVGRESGIILGGEIAGGLTVGELTNTLGFIIQNRMDINSILTAQIGTHPLLTASPAAYPLLKAAGNVAVQIIFNN